MIIYGEPEEAVRYLQETFEKYKNDPEPAYNVEMALVEILIYQVQLPKCLGANFHQNACKGPQSWHICSFLPI